MWGKIGMAKILLKSLQHYIGYVPIPPLYKDGNANTAFAHHAKRTYALYEVDYPFHIVVDKNLNHFDIKSIGHDDF